MSRINRLIQAMGSIALVASIAGSLGLVAHSPQVARTAPTVSRGMIAALTIPFIENDGQLDPRVAFYTPTFAGTVFVTRDGSMVLGLPARNNGKHAETWALTERPLGHAATPHGKHMASAQMAIFAGARARNGAGSVAYDELDMGQPWNGIELTYRAHSRDVERLFTVGPGADPAEIRMAMDGVQSLSLDDGALVAYTGFGRVVLSKPIAYQQVDGQRHLIPVHYRLDGRQYGFTLGAYDHHADVTIDPLIQATYLAGPSGTPNLDIDNGISAIAFGSNNQLYVAGLTQSPAFPGTSGCSPCSTFLQTMVFVARTSPDLKTLFQATYFGFASSTQPPEIDSVTMTIDPNNQNVYIAGGFFSNGSGPPVDLPAVSGGAQATTDGNDAFVAELNQDLTTVLQTTYLGGSSGEDASAISIGPNGDVYVAGITGSTDFPHITGGALATFASDVFSIAFVSELSPDLKSIVQSTYVGDDYFGSSPVMATDAAGDVYVGGVTDSTTLPSTTGGVQPALNNPEHLLPATNEFITEVSEDLKTTKQATYLGEGSEDGVAGLAVDTHGDVYLAGNTESLTFPGTSGGAEATTPGDSNVCVVAKLSANLKTLDQSTFLSGGAPSFCAALNLDSAGNVYIAGTTSSMDFPHAALGFDPSNCDDFNSSCGFVAKLNSALTQISAASYYGGVEFDSGTTPAALANGSNDSLYLAGTTSLGVDLPGTAGGLQATMLDSVATTGFIASVSNDLAGVPVLLNMSTTSQIAGTTFLLNVTVTNNSSIQTATGITLVYTLPAGIVFEPNETEGAGCNQSGQIVTCEIFNSPLAPKGGSEEVTIGMTSAASSGTVTGKVALQADQPLAAGSTAALVITVSFSKTGSSSGGGGGALGIFVLLLLGLTTLAKRARLSGRD